MKTLTAALLLLTPLCGLGQNPAQNPIMPSTTKAPGTEPVQTQADQPKVTVVSRGNDIRLVLTNIFAQAKRSLILQSNIQYSLYLSLQDTDFEKAVSVICEQAGLKFDVRDGIYHVYTKKNAPDTPAAIPTMEGEKFDSKPEPFTASTAGKKGKLSLTVLKRKVTTKLAKAPIGAVLEELGAQAGVKIELGDNVPAYRMDAVLTHTTLRYALEQVTRVAKLTYTFTDHQTILVDSRS
jgi:hypothetical protein